MVDIAHAERKHAELGASKARRWINCSGSINMERDLPDTTSEYAAEGTKAHELAEQLLHLSQGARDMLHDSALLPEGMLDAVMVYVDYVNAHANVPGAVLFIEQQFDLSPLNPPGDMYGTADTTIWTPHNRHLRVIDYKHGQGVAVDAYLNEQGMMYALGAALELGEVPDSISVVIVQPRARHPKGPIREYDFDMAALIQFKEELFAAAERTLDLNAPLLVGDWCKFCKAKPTCSAQHNHATALAQIEFSAQPAPLPEPSTLDMDQISKVLDAGDMIVDWIKAVKEHARDAKETGMDIPGYKLVHGRRGAKAWESVEAADTFLSGRKLKVAERYKKTLITPTAAAKLIEGDLPERLYRQADGRNILVPEDDTRTEVLALSAADEFETQ